MRGERAYPRPAYDVLMTAMCTQARAVRRAGEPMHHVEAE